MDLIERAREFARQKHTGQVRKYTNTPYITHPAMVAQTLADLDFEETVVAAAWLHDTVEDTDATHEEIVELFGPRVAELVRQVTDVSIGRPENRAFRKALDLQHLSQADAQGQSIKLADLIDNTASITRYDPDFARVYMREKEALLAVLTRGHEALMARAQTIMKAYQQSL